MDPETSEPKSDLDLMSEHLSRMEAAQAADDGTPAPDTSTPDPSAMPAGDRAPAPEKSGESAPDSTSQPSSTPSTAEPQKTGDPEGKIRDPKTGQFTDKKPVDQAKQGSEYRKDLDRRDKSWKAINAEKEAFAKDKTAFETERNKFNAQVETFRQEQEAARASQTPEAFDRMAATERAKANDLEARAKQAEAAGDFDKADKLHRAAMIAEGFEGMAKEKADQLRKNPPPTDHQKQEATKAAVKEWTLKAAQDFPEFGKKESPVQVEAVTWLRQLNQQHPKLAGLPEVLYFAAERAAYKTAADRVPALEKELGELKTKLTELEALTNPTPAGGSARMPSEKSWDQKSDTEQYEQLRQEAATLQR